MSEREERAKNMAASLLLTLPFIIAAAWHYGDRP